MTQRSSYASAMRDRYGDDDETDGRDGRGNSAVSLKAYLDDVSAVVRKIPPAWVRCELHTLKQGAKFVQMEFIELDASGKQVAKVYGGCFPVVWTRITAAFSDAGLPLEAGSQVLVKLETRMDPVYGIQVSVLEIDVTFALGDLNARIQAIRKGLKDAGHWDRNRRLVRPTDFTRVAVISPSGAAGLGDFRSTADRLEKAALVHFDYHEAPFQTRHAPERIVDVLRTIYRQGMDKGTRHCAVAIIRGGGASADLAWLIDPKLTEAVCRMNVPVMTGIGHERDKNLLDEVACIPCDTPSKVVEHIVNAVTRSAMAGARAVELVRSQAATIVDVSQAGLSEARNAIDRDAKETVRLADLAVRTAATGLEPGARALLDATQTLVARAAEGVRVLAGERREAATIALKDLQRRIETGTETSLHDLEFGRMRALDEIMTRIEAVPQTAQDELARLVERISSSATQTLDECSSVVAAIRERADALHPRTVLAAGYAVLRDAAGRPLTGAAAIQAARTLSAETRDGSVGLTIIDTQPKEDANADDSRDHQGPGRTSTDKVRRCVRGVAGDRGEAKAGGGPGPRRRRDRTADQACEPA